MFIFQFKSPTVLQVMFSSEGIKYSCEQCDKEFSSKECFLKHKRAVLHKNSLARHKKIVHEEIKIPCMKCNYQAISKGSLSELKRSVHEVVKYLYG